MFLIRTARSAHGTASAIAALGYLKAMQDEGQRAVITKLGGRPVSQTELRREVQAADPSQHGFTQTYTRS